MIPKAKMHAWASCKPWGIGLTLSSNANTTSDGTKPNTIWHTWRLFDEPYEFHGR